jgi:hypothetical protein
MVAGQFILTGRFSIKVCICLTKWINNPCLVTVACLCCSLYYSEQQTGLSLWKLNTKVHFYPCGVHPVALCIRIPFKYTCDRNWEFIGVTFFLSVHNIFRPLRANKFSVAIAGIFERYTKVHTSLLIYQSNGVHMLTFQLQGWQLYSGLVFNLASKWTDIPAWSFHSCWH